MARSRLINSCSIAAIRHTKLSTSVSKCVKATSAMANNARGVRSGGGSRPRSGRANENSMASALNLSRNSYRCVSLSPYVVDVFLQGVPLNLVSAIGQTRRGNCSHAPNRMSNQLCVGPGDLVFRV